MKLFNLKIDQADENIENMLNSSDLSLHRSFDSLQEISAALLMQHTAEYICLALHKAHSRQSYACERDFKASIIFWLKYKSKSSRQQLLSGMKLFLWMTAFIADHAPESS